MFHALWWWWDFLLFWKQGIVAGHELWPLHVLREYELQIIESPSCLVRCGFFESTLNYKRGSRYYLLMAGLLKSCRSQCSIFLDSMLIGNGYPCVSMCAQNAQYKGAQTAIIFLTRPAYQLFGWRARTNVAWIRRLTLVAYHECFVYCQVSEVCVTQHVLTPQFIPTGGKYRQAWLVARHELKAALLTDREIGWSKYASVRILQAISSHSRWIQQSVKSRLHSIKGFLCRVKDFPTQVTVVFLVLTNFSFSSIGIKRNFENFHWLWFKS